MNSSDALQRLKMGNFRFTENRLNHGNTDHLRRAELEAGQNPFAIILSCADSRVVPELLFDCGLGELFVIRVAGNVSNPSSIASIEYAVAHLGCQLIVVLAHESCGAVTAAKQGGDLGPNLNHLLSHIDVSPDLTVNELAKNNAKQTRKNLILQSQIIASAATDDLSILPAYYHLKSGEVEFLS